MSAQWSVRVAWAHAMTWRLHWPSLVKAVQHMDWGWDAQA